MGGECVAKGTGVTGFDTAAELRARMGDRAGVWEFLGRFAAAWSLASDPIHAEIKARVPVALREAYAVTGLLDPRRGYVDDGILVFHRSDPLITETTWGTPVADAGREDPPVVVDTGSGWRPYLDRVSLFCVDLALTEALDRVGTLENACELPPDRLPSVAAGFDRVPLPDLPMWVEVEDSPVRWYSRPGQLLRTHGEDWAWLWVRAQTAADLERIYAALPGETWSM
jgi:hypothetical protein